MWKENISLLSFEKVLSQLADEILFHLVFRDLKLIPIFL